MLRCGSAMQEDCARASVNGSNDGHGQEENPGMHMTKPE